MQSFINTQVESNKLGSQIAEEALDTQRKVDSPEKKSPEQCTSEIVAFDTNEVISEVQVL